MNEQSENRAQFLSFMMADEEYGVGILQVKEIIEYSPITKTPGMPACVLGVINLRGKVVPVIDLAVKFGMQRRPITKWSCIVVVETQAEGERVEVGLLADSVSQVFELLPDQIQPPPAFGTKVLSEFLSGMGQADEKFVLLLNLDRLLTTAELLSTHTMSAPSPAVAAATLAADAAVAGAASEPE